MRFDARDGGAPRIVCTREFDAIESVRGVLRAAPTKLCKTAVDARVERGLRFDEHPSVAVRERLDGAAVVVEHARRREREIERTMRRRRRCEKLPDAQSCGGACRSVEPRIERQTPRVGREGVVVRRLAAVKGTDEEVEVVALWSAAMTANRNTRRNRALRSRLFEGSAGSARRCEVGLHGGSLAQFRGAVDREKGRESSYDPRPMSRVSAFVRASALAVASLAILAGCQGRPMVAAKKEADFAFEHGDYAKAAPAYLEIIEKAPGDWEVEYRYGVCLAELGNLREARTHVETAQAANPKSEEVAAGLAQVYFKLGEKQKLVQLLQDRGNLQRSLPSFMLLADYALQMNDADTATTAVNGAILLADGKDFEPYLKAVEVAEKLGDTKTASRRLRQAYAINPKSPAVGAKLAEYGLAAEPTTGLPPGP